MNIRDYLCREARRITNSAVSYLPKDAESWYKQRPERLKNYLEMMGIVELPPCESRPPLNVRVTEVLERNAYRVERLYFESLPKLYVTANLYVPKGLTEPAPAVVYFCGHSPTQKVHYQAHPRRFAELGFVALIVDTVQFGEIKGYHHGCYAQGWFHWYSRGYTPGGVELWNGIRALDLLEERSEVDASRIGITGISGGGAMSWWLGAADECVRVVAPVCGTGTVASHVAERTVDGHCDCMFFINTYRWDLADVGALIAPRPLLIASSDRDGIYSIASIRECYERVRRVYQLLNAEENIVLIETPGAHSYHKRSRTTIFSWFLKHLKGVDIPPEEVGDIDDSPEVQEPEENLLVYVGDPPANERTSTIQDEYVPLAKPPEIGDIAALQKHREDVVSALRQKTFGHFPEEPPPLDAQVEMKWASDGTNSKRLVFTPEEGWRLRAKLTLPEDASGALAPVILFLRQPRAGRWHAEEFLSRFDGRWARLIVETRGVGETSWGEELSWHVRRASAIIGRTVASMRVYDALRAIEMARTLPELDGSRVTIAGSGEMTAVALYAALLDGRVVGVVLSDPPATQNMPSRPDGQGPAIEMLNCLRFTDLPQVAGLLFPTELVFVGGRPESYLWTESLYARLGKPGVIRHVKRLAGWRPYR